MKMNTSDEKIDLLRFKFNELKSHFTSPTNFLYDHFCDIKNDVDLNAENLMIQVENDSDKEKLNEKRIEIISKIDAVYNQSLTQCANDMIKNDHLLNLVTNAIETISLKLDELNQDIFNDSIMEDQLIEMLCEDSIEAMNKSVCQFKQKTFEEKFDEVDNQIEEMNCILNKFLFMDKSFMFVDKIECQQILEYLNKHVNCAIKPIRDVIYAKHDAFNYCPCFYCNPLNNYEEDDDYNDYYEHEYYDEEEYEDEEGYDDGEEVESNDTSIEIDGNDNFVVNDTDVIFISERKPEDLFFGVFLILNGHVSTKKTFLSGIEMLTDYKIKCSITKPLLKTFLTMKKITEMLKPLDMLKQNQILEVQIADKLNNLAIFGTKFTLIDKELFNEYQDLEMFQINGQANDLKFHDKCFNGCINLTSIDFSYCGLQTIDFNIFADLVKLKDLNLSSNQITKITPLTNEKKIYLIKLNLDRNRLTNIYSSFFDQFIKILELCLKSNMIESFKLANRTIETIDLSLNRFKSIDLMQFSSLSKLKKLDLSRNLIKTVIHSNDGVTYKSNLTILNLNYNNIESIDSEAFSSLVRLESLDLSHNSIQSLNRNLFRELSSLTFLDLSYNRIEIIKSFYFFISRTPQLKVLDLSFNNITSYEKDCFFYLKKIEMVFVYGNKSVRVQYSDKNRYEAFLKIRKKDITMYKIH